MAIRKSMEETLELSDTKEALLEKCERALNANGFSSVTTNRTLFQVTGFVAQ